MSWFSLFTEKQKLKHKVRMLEDTVNNNPFTQMDYQIKELKYNKQVVLETFKCFGMAIVTGSLIILYFKYC
jgi:hypothetical protein